jgi:hypothetical protein
MRRLIALATCLLVCALSPVGVAHAADGATGSGGSNGGTIWAGVQTSTPPSSLDGSGGVCRWAAETAYDSSTGTGSRTPITMRLNGLRYRLFNRTCNGRRRLVWIPQLSPRQLATQSSLLVYGKLPRPGFRFAPSADDVVVKVGTWIWTDPSAWKPVTATAWIPTPTGIIWTRTTATPITMQFDTDDAIYPGGGRGNTTCLGPGVPWTPLAGDTLSSPCSYTYRHASSSRPGGRFPATMSVTWAITWTSNVGAGGILPPYTNSANLTVRVRELQALVE